MICFQNKSRKLVTLFVSLSLIGCIYNGNDDPIIKQNMAVPHIILKKCSDF